MARCPVCESVHIVIVLSPGRRSFCSHCGARWIQKGSQQSAVHRLDSTALNIASVSVHPIRPPNVILQRTTM